MIVKAENISLTFFVYIECTYVEVVLVLGSILRWSLKLSPQFQAYIIPRTVNMVAFIPMIRLCDRTQMTVKQGAAEVW